MKTLGEVRAATVGYFESVGIPSARLDAELLLAKVLGLQRVQVYAQFERLLTESELAALRPLVKRRAGREPLAWILGTKGFHAHDFEVRPGTLVPRPDTETLVELALAWIPADADPVYVADVGCGTGCVGLSVAAARPGVRLYALDLSEVARDTTTANVAKLGLEARVAVVRSDLLAAVPPERPVDWVLSNPPLALDGGPDGLDVVRRLVRQAATRAREGILLEIGAGQAAETARILGAAGFVDVTIRADLGGIDRVVAGRRAADPVG